MKRTYTIKMQAISDKDEAPKLTQADFDRAHFKVSGKTVHADAWKRVVQEQVSKARINIMLDVPIIEHFKALAGERGYQTLINETLRRVIESGKIEADLRKIIREEIAAMSG